MNQSQQAEWLQKLILIGIGLVISSFHNPLGLPYDSFARYLFDAVIRQYQAAAPLVLFVLIAFYIGLESLTEDIQVETVIFTESKETR